MGNNKIGLKKPLGGTETPLTPIPVEYLESKVRFTFRDCNTDKFCIRELTDTEITKFYKRLGYLEELTWRQAKQMPRENGFSIEKKETGNFSYLSGLHPQKFNTFLHFRVLGLEIPFRVFGALNNDLCHLLLIDREGVVNH